MGIHIDLRKTRDQLRLFSFSVFFIICLAQCYNIAKSFIQYPFFIDMFDFHPNLRQALPGITICNNNRMSLKKLATRNPVVGRALVEKFPDWFKDQRPQFGSRFNEFRDNVATIFERLNYDPQTEMDNTTMNNQFNIKPDSNRLIRWFACARTWQDSIECGSLTRIDSVQDRRCTTLLHNGAIIYDTINNPHLFNGSASKTKKYGSYFDVKEVVRMLLDFDPEDYADLKRQIGARIIFHSNNYVGSSTDLDFYVTRGYRYDFNIDREDLLLLSRPYGNCFNFEEENSYTFEDRVNPRVPLTSATCVQNCVVRNVVHMANCWPLTTPYFRNDSLDPELRLKPCNWYKEHQHYSIFREMDRVEKLRKLGPVSWNQTNEKQQQRQQPNGQEDTSGDYKNHMKIRRHCVAQCAAPCRVIKYSVTVTRSKWPSEVRTLFDKTGSDSMLNHCCALVTVKTTHHHYKVHRFLPKYNLVDTVGNVGGLLAVWLGLSMVSLYHAIQKLVELCNERSLAKVNVRIITR